jgi:hypothetical protein
MGGDLNTLSMRQINMNQMSVKIKDVE